ncbi:MAG: protein jag [Oscillospiraceae bacterium]|nr:protein jag [Oscillospiraceae bacterium]
MINTLEKSARTVDAAIEEALKELGMSRDDVSVEILDMGKTGFLGFGASPARVRVSYETPDPAPEKPEKPAPAPKAEKKPAPAKAEKPAKTEKPKAEKPAPKAEAEAKPAPAVIDESADYAAIRSFLSGLLDRMGVNAEMEISPRDNGGINVNLTGPAMGAIIGRRGETLDAIQHLTNYVVNKDSEKHLHISVDAEAYRSKREDSLTRLAEKMAEKAIKYKRSMALEPMNSYERHVIHTALQNYEGVTTSSTGVEPNRRVVVSYVRPDKPEQKPDNKPKSREWA